MLISGQMQREIVVKMDTLEDQLSGSAMDVLESLLAISLIE